MEKGITSKKGKQFEILNQIKEVSEQYSRHNRHNASNSLKKYNKKNLRRQQSQKSDGIVQRSIQCIKNIYQKINQKITKNQINIDESKMSEILMKMKQKKSKISLLPKKVDDKKTLILDLDQTLIYAFFKPRSQKQYDFFIELQGKDKTTKIFVKKRYGLDSFLFQMSKSYELILFSSGKRQYVDSILKIIDPKKRISYSLSREHCLNINKYYWVKQLNNLSRDLNKTILIDDNKMAAMLNQQNLYQIKPFKGNQKDRQLIKLGHFLNSLKQQEKIVPVNSLFEKYKSRSIHLQAQKDSDILQQLQFSQSQRSLEGVAEKTGICMIKYQD